MGGSGWLLEGTLQQAHYMMGLLLTYLAIGTGERIPDCNDDPTNTETCNDIFILKPICPSTAQLLLYILEVFFFLLLCDK